MKIAVIGAGAMGSIYAGLMADAGYEVWAIDLWADHVAAMATTGLRVEGASGDRIVTTVNASTDFADAGACDLYIIATKASGVEGAAKAISEIARPDSLILTIQNGLGAGQRIATHMPVDNVILGVAEGFGAGMKGPGHVYHSSMKMIRIGEINGGMTDRLENLAKVWQHAGFDVQAFADIDQLIWEKFLCNVALAGPCTVFGRTLGEMKDDPATWHIVLSCLREAYQIGCAKQINFSFDDPDEYLTAFANRMLDAKPSMLQDHLAGRVSEIDAINGMVPLLGRELGIATPYNDVIVSAVRAREATFRK